MDFDGSKENIQPLPGGRRVEQLGLALDTEKNQETLAQQKQEHETAIETYVGDDPLDAWYDYVSWIEQSYPRSGKESHLDEVIIRCIERFEHDLAYRQDRRMVKIFMKFIDTQPNPTEFYQELYNQGIGTMVADLYIAWAHYYDAVDNFKQAEAIYRKGLDARAQPIADLETAHKQFGFSMSQRILYKDDPESREQVQSSMQERRNALTSLRAYKKKTVGTARTGAAVRSHNPGLVNQENVSNNVPKVLVFNDTQEASTSTAAARSDSVVRSMIDSAREQENTHEPGPWNKAKLGKTGAAISSTKSQLSFAILEDVGGISPIPYTVRTFHEGFKKPKLFFAQNVPQKDNWAKDKLPFTEDTVPENTLPMYSKPFLYPRQGEEYSSEELKGYLWFKKRGVNNSFSEKYEKIWGPSSGVRLPSNYARKNLPQKISPADDDVEEHLAGLQVKSLKISPEELYAIEWKKNPRRAKPDDLMEETFIEGPRRVSIHPVRVSEIRKSMARKSLMPIRGPPAPHQVSLVVEENEIEDKTEDLPVEAPAVNATSPEIPAEPAIKLPEIQPQPRSILSFKEIFKPPVEERAKPEVAAIESQPNAPLPVAQFKPRDSILLFKQKLTRTSAEEQMSQEKRKAEDSPDGRQTSAKNPCAIDTPIKFKAPEPTKFTEFAVPKVPPKSPFPIFEDEPSPYLNPNDTCTTQSFGDFLKAGAVSTPIQTVKAKKRIETPQESLETPPSYIEPLPMPTAIAEQQKLSTIMETTEPTSSTGGSSKYAISSPESDGDAVVNVPETLLPSSSACGFVIFEDKTEQLPIGPFVPSTPSVLHAERDLSMPVREQTQKEPSMLSKFIIFEDDELTKIPQKENPPAKCSPHVSSMLSFQTDSPGVKTATLKQEKSVASLLKEVSLHDTKVPFQVFDNEPPKLTETRGDPFFDMFAMSPAKPSETLYTTQALLKLNVQEIMDTKESPFKREPSLHIHDDFVVPAPPTRIAPPPLFLEDDQINTLQFKPDTNSTLIGAQFKVPPPVVSVKHSLSLGEDEIQELASAEPPKAEVQPPKRPTRIRKSRYSVAPLPALALAPTTAAVVAVEDEDDDLGKSIYHHSENVESHENTPEDWHEDHTTFKEYVQNVDADGVIHEHFSGDFVNPFERVLTSALLDNVKFRDYLEGLDTCTFTQYIGPLKKKMKVNVGNKEFEVLKSIGEGSYGKVFSAKCASTGRIYALKQEKPSNLWEYYICLEILSRIANPEILPGYMSIEYAHIANNASILGSKLSKYGTLIEVCNKIKRVTNKNTDEFVVMFIISQILKLIDHLHSCEIIHADIKPDNFLLMAPLEHGNPKPVVQLIDFGISIDMKLMPEGVTFKLVDEENPCIEMRMGKPWTYQVDLYGVAGVAHAMLFGKYIEVEEKMCRWNIKTKYPRYFNKEIWDTFFTTLLNVRNCKELPNLQNLRSMFEEELVNKDRLAKDKINEFNMVLSS